MACGVDTEEVILKKRNAALQVGPEGLDVGAVEELGGFFVIGAFSGFAVEVAGYAAGVVAESEKRVTGNGVGVGKGTFGGWDGGTKIYLKEKGQHRPAESTCGVEAQALTTQSLKGPFLTQPPPVPLGSTTRASSFDGTP